MLFIFFCGCKKDPAFPQPAPPGTDSLIVAPTIKRCNGYAELCDKKFNEVVYVTTHNAFNAKYAGSVNYTFPNQNYRIGTQLKEGVRGFMVDVYEGNNGEPVVYHGFSFTGSEPLSGILQEIRLFLDTNPREVVTLILECNVSGTLISQAMTASGLEKFLYTHAPGSSWETLGQMIINGKRLVIFSDKEDAGDLTWYHYLWDYCIETGFSASSKEELDCSFNRGDSSNSLFILNHFITNLVGTGQPDQAAVINANPYFINKARECMTLHGKLPNFLTVDFYSSGNVFEVANELNGVK